MGSPLFQPPFRQISSVLWELPGRAGMRVPGHIYADSELMAALERDQSLDQVRNVAHLPGIIRCSLAMPTFITATASPSGSGRLRVR